MRLCVGLEEVVLENTGVVEVVHVDDVETSLKNSQKFETMLIDVPFRITPKKVSKAGSETVCGDLEEALVETSVQNNFGNEEVEAGVEESKTMDGKDSVPGHEGTQDVAFAISNCRGVYEATY